VRLTAEQTAIITANLRTSLQAMHKAIDNIRSKDDIGTATAPPGVDVNFDVGDYVLWAKDVAALKQHQDKLHAKWYGPMRVTAVLTPWIYEIEDLIDGTKHKAHTRRLKYYIDSSLNITEELKQQLRHDNAQYDIQAFIDRRCVNKKKNKWELLVQWTGFEGENTWEPVLQLYQDVPTLVKQYIKEVDVPAEAARLTASIATAHPTFI
jgi:hypothetical protein